MTNQTPGPYIKRDYGCFEVWTSPVKGTRLATFTNKVHADALLTAVNENPLLAAAPETAAERDRLRAVNVGLLAALEQVERIANRAGGHGVICQQVLRAARAAIAKHKTD